MMLNLEIQSSNQPGYHRVIGSEVSRRLDLVNSPFILQLPGLHIGDGKGSMLDSMRQLENNAQDKPCYTGENDKSDQPGRKADSIDRDEHEQEGVKKLESPEHKMIGNR